MMTPPHRSENDCLQMVQQKMHKKLKPLSSVSIGRRPLCTMRFADDIDLLGGTKETLRQLTERPEKTVPTLIGQAVQISYDNSKILNKTRSRWTAITEDAFVGGGGGAKNDAQASWQLVRQLQYGHVSLRVAHITVFRQRRQSTLITNRHTHIHRSRNNRRRKENSPQQAIGRPIYVEAVKNHESSV